MSRYSNEFSNEMRRFEHLKCSRSKVSNTERLFLLSVSFSIESLTSKITRLRITKKPSLSKVNEDPQEISNSLIDVCLFSSARVAISRFLLTGLPNSSGFKGPGVLFAPS